MARHGAAREFGRRHYRLYAAHQYGGWLLAAAAVVTAAAVGASSWMTG